MLKLLQYSNYVYIIIVMQIKLMLLFYLLGTARIILRLVVDKST